MMKRNIIALLFAFFAMSCSPVLGMEPLSGQQGGASNIFSSKKRKRDKDNDSSIPRGKRQKTGQKSPYDPICLDFSENPTTEECCCLLKPNSFLRVTIKNCKDKDVLSLLKAASEKNRLEVLTLENVSCTPRDIDCLAEVIEKSKDSLEHITLTGCSKIMKKDFERFVRSVIDQLPRIARITFNGVRLRLNDMRGEFSNDTYISPLLRNCFLKGDKRGFVQNPQPWFLVGEVIERFKEMHERFLERNNMTSDFQRGSYVRKMVLPDQNTRYKVLVVGDLHGSAFALARNLRRWIDKGYLTKNYRVKPNCRVVFTGDIADRGSQDILTWYVLMRFALVNEGRVFVCRGNHETDEINRLLGKNGKKTLLRSVMKEYSKGEYDRQWKVACYFPSVEKQFEVFYEAATCYKYSQFVDMFNYLPCAVYIGREKDFIQVCHGLLPTDRHFLTNIKAFLDDESKLCYEFTVGPNCEKIKWQFLQGDFGTSKRNALVPGNDVWQACQTAGIKCVFRGHQHNNHVVSWFSSSKNGWCAVNRISLENWLRSYQKFVYTFMCCPENVVKAEGYGVATVNGAFSQWTLCSKQDKVDYDDYHV